MKNKNNKYNPRPAWAGWVDPLKAGPKPAPFLTGLPIEGFGRA